jgi:hypothetical protein
MERHFSISGAIPMKRYAGKMNRALNEGQGVEDWVLALCTAELMRSRWHLSGHVFGVPFLVQAALYSSCELTQRDLTVAISIAKLECIMEVYSHANGNSGGAIAVDLP